MFRKTGIRLVLWNAAVVALILALFAVVVYSATRISLLKGVDRQTEQQLKPAIQAVKRGRLPPSLLRGGRRATSDSPLVPPPLGVLIWRSSGELVSPVPTYLTQKDMSAIRTIALSGKSKTVDLDGNEVRAVVMTLPGSAAGQLQSPPSSSGTASATTTSGGQAAVQIKPGRPVLHVVGLRNIDSLVHTLQQLKWLALTSGALGLLLAATAGFLLAYRALIPIRRAWDRQVDFVADASHELRTPLTAVAVNAESLMNEHANLTEQQRRMVSSIFLESKRLGRLLNHLLNLARMDAKTEQVVFRETHIHDLTTEVAEQFAPLCEVDGLLLNVEIKTTTTALVDEERLRQVLFNLLDNARKFTPKGGTITLGCYSTRRALVWTVRDTGIGIPKDRLHLIFNRFYRGNDSRQTGLGSGLGLSIVKWIVESHGGSIHVSSEPEQGTEFTVSIPLRTHV